MAIDAGMVAAVGVVVAHVAVETLTAKAKSLEGSILNIKRSEMNVEEYRAIRNMVEAQLEATYAEARAAKKLHEEYIKSALDNV